MEKKQIENYTFYVLTMIHLRIIILLPLKIEITDNSMLLSPPPPPPPALQ